jgi:subtilisin family serine protease
MQPEGRQPESGQDNGHPDKGHWDNGQPQDGDDAQRRRKREETDEFSPDKLSRQTAPPDLEDDDNRRRWKLGTSEEDRGPYLVELNVLHVDGLSGATNAFRGLFEEVFGPRSASGGKPWNLTKISKGYFRIEMTLAEWKLLVAKDQARAIADAGFATSSQTSRRANDFPYRTIYRLWPDFPVRPHISRSVSTIKADAALRSFEANGAGICWAVLDSGVEASHPHFGSADNHLLLDPAVSNLHRCFVDVNGERLADPDEERATGRRPTTTQRNNLIKRHQELALSDDLGHGTHVAGIISGAASSSPGVTNVVLERQDRIVAGDENENEPERVTETQATTVSEPEAKRFHGVAPGCRLVSLRVLDAEGGGRSSDIIRALEYVREKLNDNPKLLRVHGVNLSVGYDFDAEMFACGQSPLCTEVNRLVQSGVIVVTAAGNTGYSTLPTSSRVAKVGLSNTINDPGNADGAITVGSTHRESPHTFGISYFSSKGPTADGRLKPDLVAPGERILSCAAGTKRDKAIGTLSEVGKAVVSQPPTDGRNAGAAGNVKTAYYVEDSGTSMAAPHVSGAIAAFLSIRREYIGRPEEIKRIFLSNATPLGREHYFEGHGLVDLMRAIQSV